MPETCACDVHKFMQAYIHIKKKIFKAKMVLNTFNLSTWEAEAGEYLEFKTSLAFRASFRTAEVKLSQENKLCSLCTLLQKYLVFENKGYSFHI